MLNQSRPMTLLAMAGANPAPSRLREAALVIVDAQHEYLDGALPLAGIGTALQAAQDLLNRARAAAAPVFHVVHLGRPGGAFAPGSSGARIADAVAPHPGEALVEKRLPNAFAGTDLLERLKHVGKTDLILAGFMTHMCVESTARTAIDHGLRVTVVAAATATRDLPHPIDGTTLPAAEVQRNAMAAMADRFATIVAGVGEISD